MMHFCGTCFIGSKGMLKAARRLPKHASCSLIIPQQASSAITSSCFPVISLLAAYCGHAACSSHAYTWVKSTIHEVRSCMFPFEKDSSLAQQATPEICELRCSRQALPTSYCIDGVVICKGAKVQQKDLTSQVKHTKSGPRSCDDICLDAW